MQYKDAGPSLPVRSTLKKVAVLADDGKVHSASLSLNGFDKVSEVRDALGELVAEILEDDSLLDDDLHIELRDELGRRRSMVDEMPLSAVLRAASLHVKATQQRC